jgi:DnaJ-class molecular chaperone
MAIFEETSEARKLLGLGEAATLKEIKQAYRRMSHRHHPDKNRDRGNHSPDEETMKKLNWSYKLLMDYCNLYSYSFKEEDIARAYPHDEYLNRFYQDWFNRI